MSTYVNMGSRRATGILDTTGNNPGNWTVTFDPNTLNSTMPLFEVCHIVVNAKPGASATVFIDNNQWDTTLNAYNNSWDPAVALPLRPGQYLYFYYSDAATDGQAPQVTIWLRYDQDVEANQQTLINQAGQ